MARKRKGNPVNGWVNLDKPLELGSTQAVSRVRRLFNAQKAGHAGTLDPLASGILPIALGEATKTVPFLMDATKTYLFTVGWGQETTTCDGEGDVIATSDHRPDGPDIRAVLDRFIGRIDQRPPAYSAIKVNGRRAYDLARAGNAPDLPPRSVHIHALSLLSQPDRDHACFQVTCGKGTYVRALGRDLARALGTCGYISALRRTQVGQFTTDHAVTLAQLEQAAKNSLAPADALGHSPPAFGQEQDSGPHVLLTHLQSIETALDDIPALALSESEAALLKNGRAVQLRRTTKMSGAEPPADGTLLLAKTADKAIALVRVTGSDIVPTRVFNL